MIISEDKYMLNTALSSDQENGGVSWHVHLKQISKFCLSLPEPRRLRGSGICPHPERMPEALTRALSPARNTSRNSPFRLSKGQYRKGRKSLSSGNN